ncbi:MAG: histone deacetylase [Thermoproteus sp.]
MKVLAAEGYEDDRIRAIPPSLLQRISSRGSWEQYLKIHGGPLANAAKRREEEVLAAVGLLEEVLRRGGGFVLTYPPRDIGHSSGRGGFLNAVAYLAESLEAAVVALDAHFPWGTWDLHLRLGFPLLLIYGGPDGPAPGRLARKSDKVVAIPLPPGASDRSIRAALRLVEAFERPVVFEVGFDLYRLEPAGHFFATAELYYEAGRLAGGEGYVVVDCLSGRSAVALEAMLAGADGAENPIREEPVEEGRAVVREVERALRRARDRINKIGKTK